MSTDASCPVPVDLHHLDLTDSEAKFAHPTWVPTGNTTWVPTANTDYGLGSFSPQYSSPAAVLAWSPAIDAALKSLKAVKATEQPQQRNTTPLPPRLPSTTDAAKGAQKAPEPKQQPVYVNGQKITAVSADAVLYHPYAHQEPNDAPARYARLPDGTWWVFRDNDCNRYCGPEVISYLDSAVGTQALRGVDTECWDEDDEDPPEPPRLTVAGIALSPAQLAEAVTILAEATSAYVRKSLEVAGHPLGGADLGVLRALVKRGWAMDQGLSTGPYKSRLGLRRYLSTVYDQLTPLVRDIYPDEAPPQPIPPGGSETFRAAPDQPTLTGFHRKTILLDQDEARWVFKPAAGGHAYRAEVEHEAHRLARLWGYPTADSRLISFDGHYGQAQRLFEADQSLVGITAETIGKLTEPQLIALAKEHLLDWALDNDDSHGDNLLITTTGQLVGIDKGRAWRYFGGWPGLSGTAHANTNCALAATELFTAIAQHALPRDLVDRIYQAVIDQAQRMQFLPDKTVRTIVGRAMAHRPHYKPSTYQTPVPGAPTNAEELVGAVLDRKNRLVQDMNTLWTQVYQAAGWQPPLMHPLGANPQGHRMLAGLEDPALPERIALTKFHGTPVFVAGTHIEDAHIICWRERRLPETDSFVVRGQFKLRGKPLAAVKTWLTEHATDATKTTLPPGQDGPPGERSAYEAIIDAVRTVSVDIPFSSGNNDKLWELHRTRSRLSYQLRNLSYRATCGALSTVEQATVEMCETYLGYINVIDERIRNRTPCGTGGDFPRFQWTPPDTDSQPASPLPFTVTRAYATRDSCGYGGKANIAADGELVLRGDKLAGPDLGQAGEMYLVELPSGESIDLRPGAGTHTPLTLHGWVMFSIGHDDIPAGLKRITAALETMGVHLNPADPVDLELYYWRHLAGVMVNRADTRAEHLPSFWSIAHAIDGRASRAAQLEQWREAFAALTSSQGVHDFLARGGHLPRFQHLDVRRPSMPCGRPHWERIDVSAEQAADKPLPSIHYRRGPRYALHSGACYSTEARVRALGTWKVGQSSSEDLSHGSGAYVFCRQNRDHRLNERPTFLFNQQVLRRTTTFAYAADLYGRLCEREKNAHHQFDAMTAHTLSSNELMVREALSILDDVEAMFFEHQHERQEAIAWFAEHGITHLRGLPVPSRLLCFADPHTNRDTIAAIREHIRRQLREQAGLC